MRMRKGREKKSIEARKERRGEERVKKDIANLHTG